MKVLKRVVREPLLHFLIIGAALFLLWGNGPETVPAKRANATSTEILVSQGDLTQMAETFRRTWQRAPIQAELNSLLENFVRDEIYYREALAAGLDRDDNVIRWRLRLKMEYLFEDIAAQGEPTEQELRGYMEKHSAKYRVEPQLDFLQVFVNSDQRGANAENEARGILAQLRAGAAPQGLGDSSMLVREFRNAPVWQIQSQFGEGFVSALLDLPQGSWQGPLRSGFGLHLVRVDQHTAGRLPELAQIRTVVARDLAAARQQDLKDAAYARLRERYTVTVETPPAVTRVDTQGEH